MGEEAAVERYEPGPAFEEVKEETMLDMSLTDSKEFWLIQWIKDKELDVSDFHGKDVSVKLHKDGNLGSLESSSGKSYNLVSFAYQQPNATVFLPSGSEMKSVGKISRRVCLIRHRQHVELEKLNFACLNPSSKKSAERKGSDSSAPVLGGSDMQNTMSMQSAGQEIQNGEPGPSVPKISTTTCKTNSSAGSSKKALAKRKTGSSTKALAKKSKRSRCVTSRSAKYESNVGHTAVPGKTSGVPDAGGAQSNTATEVPQATPEEQPRKKVKIAKQ